MHGGAGAGGRARRAWSEDLTRHIDFEGWQFITRDGELTYELANKKKPIVCFDSFQDFLQRTAGGAIKPRNEWVHDTEWDCVILDEYHYGAWRENAKGLFGADEEDTGEVSEEVTKVEAEFDESILPINTDHYLYLSGTPFRALASGEFIEEQIYNWTYSDEQRAKRDWKGPGANPYAALPRLVLMTYTLPDDIRQVADDNGEEIVVKPECYVFDFAPNRALRQIADYGSRLATDDTTVEQRVAELVGFLPVLAYDGSSMRQLDAAAILDIATAGTSGRTWDCSIRC